MTIKAEGVPSPEQLAASTRRKTRFGSYGEEMIQKRVARSGQSGLLYLPSDWVGKRVKIIRLD